MIRLRPAPHCRTKVDCYSLRVTPADHFVNWQQDPHGNWQARYVFPERVTEFKIEVDVIADMTVIQSVRFLRRRAAPSICRSTIREDLRPDLAIYREPEPAGPALAAFLARLDRNAERTVDFLVELNAACRSEVRYVIRMEPGVQTPEETLTLRLRLVPRLRAGCWSRSCATSASPPASSRATSSSSSPISIRSKGRRAPITISPTCTPGRKSICPAPAGSASTRPRACCAAKAICRLCATPHYRTAAPISGARRAAEVEFAFDMKVERVSRASAHHEAVFRRGVGRSSTRWATRSTAISQARTCASPWAASRPSSRSTISNRRNGTRTPSARPSGCSPISLIRRLRDRFAPGGFLHYGQGKWYPGETPAALGLFALLAARRQADLARRRR